MSTNQLELLLCG